MGYIQGSDPVLKDDVIIVGANLDHLGFCYEVMPGANDNASGIAVLLAVAEVLSQSPVKPKRTILFIAFGSNEQGFLGVQTYLKQPFFPLDRTKAFIGLERVGCGQKYYVTGSEKYPGLYKHLRKSNKKYSSYEMDGFRFSVLGLPASDAVFFHKKHIPALLISTVEEPVSFSGRQDTYDKVDPKIMSELVKVLYFSLLDIAGQSELNLF
jgi:Zn-dependent M28 family amino/carboxypeptidase